MIEMVCAPPITWKVTTVVSLVCLTPEGSSLYLGTFLGKMQELHHEIRQRVKQLEWGAEPAACRPQYIENDQNIQLAKDSLQQWLDRTPNPPEIDLRARLLRHLDRVQHMIG